VPHYDNSSVGQVLSLALLQVDSSFRYYLVCVMLGLSRFDAQLRLERVVPEVNASLLGLQLVAYALYLDYFCYTEHLVQVAITPPRLPVYRS